MLTDELNEMKNFSKKSYYDMIVAELSNKIEIPLGFDFESLQSETKSFIKKKSIFGADLTFEGVCQVNQLIEHICRAENIVLEGLFRKSGSRVRQNELADHLASANFEFDLMSDNYNIHDVCCVLKRFITELPQPPLTNALTSLFLQTVPIKVPATQLDALRLLILLLPNTQLSFLRDLFGMFENIVKHSKKNLMTSDNLSVIFAPMFFYSADTSAEKLKEALPRITKCLKIMIENSEHLFSAPENINENAKVFLEKCAAYQKVVSTTCLIPHAKLCASSVKTEPSDYTQQQMALLFAELQKTVQEKDKKKKKFSSKRQKELLNLATNQNACGTPLVKLERDKEQQELIKKHLKQKQNGFKEFGSQIKKKLFTPKKYQLQPSSGSASARRRRSMEFKETFITPRSQRTASTAGQTPRVARPVTPKQRTPKQRTPKPKTPEAVPSTSADLFRDLDIEDIPPPLPPKPRQSMSTRPGRRHSLKPRNSPHPKSISTLTFSCQKENRRQSVSTKSLPTRRNILLQGTRNNRVKNLIARHEEMVASAAKIPPQFEANCEEYVELSRIPVSVNRVSSTRTTNPSRPQQRLNFDHHELHTPL